MRSCSARRPALSDLRTAFQELLDINELTLAELLALPVLDDLLALHVLGDELLAEELTEGLVIETLAGVELNVQFVDLGIVLVNGPQAALIIEPDLDASNGVVHVINAVLVPPAADPLTCGELNACFNDCPVDDQVCIDDCVASASQEALDLFNAIGTCSQAKVNELTPKDKHANLKTEALEKLDVAFFSNRTKKL